MKNLAEFRQNGQISNACKPLADVGRLSVLCVMFLPNGDNLSKVKFIIVHLGDEDCSHGLVQCGTIHVYCGANRQHKADDTSVDVIVLEEALEGDRQRGRAENKYKTSI